MDVAPTILSLLGGKYRSVFFGRDVLETPAASGRAVMQHNHDVALLDANGRMVVLGFNRRASVFQVDPITFELHALQQPDPAMLQTTAALFQTAYDLYYTNRWFPETRERGE
jgi:hypothetical protein